MTVSATTNKQRTAGNGATTAFPATIKIFAETDIKVTTINNTTDALVNTLLLNDGGALGFTVVFDTDAETLTVTANTAPTSAEDIQILRVLPQTQTTDFPRATKFPALLNENALDKNTMILQDQQEVINRALVLPEESSLTNPALPEPVAGKALLWNAAATDLENSTDDFNDIVTDATTQAVAAAASASAASTSETNAATSETNAATSATNAATSETNAAADAVSTAADAVSTAADAVSTAADAAAASTSASNASTSETNAATSATNAATSETNAATSASNAATSETNAATSATNAATSETNAATSETNAGTSETNAATSETNAAASAAAVAPKWLFDASTAMADPGTGDIRLNNAALGSVTQIAISALTAETGNPDLSDFIITWDDSSHTPRGTITIRKGTAPGTFAIYSVTGAITDNATWLQIPVTFVDSNGTFSASDSMFTGFARSGDDGGGLANVVEDTTPQLGGFLDTNSFAINESEGAAVASATTTDIFGGNDGNTLHITGTTTIVDFTDASSVGQWRKIIFDGVLTLTHGSGITLPGSANITTAAGDYAFVYADTVSAFTVLYFKADGTAVAGGGGAMTLLATATAAASTELDFNSLISTSFSKYKLVFVDLITSAAAVINFQTDAAATFVTGDAIHTHQNDKYTLGGTTAIILTGAVNQTSVPLIAAGEVGAGGVWYGEMDFYINTGGAHRFGFESLILDDQGTQPTKARGVGRSSTNVGSIRINPASGNFTSGTVHLYGVENT